MSVVGHIPPFLDLVSRCLKRYLMEKHYQIIIENIHGLTPWRMISIRMRIWPAGTAKRDGHITIHEDGRLELHGYIPPTQFLNIETNIHDPDSFPKIEQFLDKVFADWQT